MLHAELMYGTVQSKPRLAWKIVVRTSKPLAEWKLYLDAYSGEVLTRCNMLKHKAARGRVFDPNPVAVLNDTTLTDRSTIPTKAYSDVVLPDVAPGALLDGPYVTTALTSNRVRSTARKFLYRRGKRGFKEVMVYFHIDRAQRYLQLLGFNGVLDHPIGVNVAGGRDDNSFYSPGTTTLVVRHRRRRRCRGRRDHPARIRPRDPGCAGAGLGRGRRGDGDGRRLRRLLRGKLLRGGEAGRDASDRGQLGRTFYSAENPPALRRLDSNKKYPKDLTSDEHDNGELWSASLWQLRTAVGRHVADRLVIAHHFLLNRRARFEDAANALLTADRQLYQSNHAEAIRQIFVARGMSAQPQAQAAARGTALRSVESFRRRVSPASACGIRARRCRRRASVTSASSAACRSARRPCRARSGRRRATRASRRRKRRPSARGSAR